MLGGATARRWITIPPRKQAMISITHSPLTSVHPNFQRDRSFIALPSTGKRISWEDSLPQTFPPGQSCKLTRLTRWGLGAASRPTLPKRKDIGGHSPSKPPTREATG